VCIVPEWVKLIAEEDTGDRQKAELQLNAKAQRTQRNAKGERERQKAELQLNAEAQRRRGTQRKQQKQKAKDRRFKEQQLKAAI
jgi:hypothetical protein